MMRSSTQFLSGRAARLGLGGLVAVALVAAMLAVVDDRSAKAVGPGCSLLDGLEFNDNCCEPIEPQLPQFPAIKQDIRYITWNRCNLARNKPLCVDIGVPLAPLGCGVYLIDFNMRTCGAQEISLFTGGMLGTYARTWAEETDPDNPGTDVQVWRIMVNGDLAPSEFLLDRFGTNPHIPQCYAAHGNQIHWFGYIDYRLDCVNQEWSVQWAINHDCDVYHHNDDSGRPGDFHPTRSFNMVGPATFTPSAAIPAARGFVGQENLREGTLVPPGIPSCFPDETIADGFLEVLDNLCPCTSAGGPQYALSDMFASSLCGSGFATTNDQKNFVQKRFGTFEEAPGSPRRELSFAMGDVLWTSACTQTSREYMEGVVTTGGPPAFTWDLNGRQVPLFPIFVDAGSSNGDNCIFQKGVPHAHCKLICANVIEK